MISEPGVKPSDAVELTVRVAVAVLLAPIVTCLTVPIVVTGVPVVNVTGPVSVPAVRPVTVADKVTLLPKAKDVGLALTVVVVEPVPCATTVIVTLELVEPV
jgi:hypothetical protein